MDNSSYVALSGAMTLRRSLDITANNVANMNTSGFKAEKPVFEEYLHRSARGQNYRQDTSFTLDKGSFLDERQGGMTPTGNPLDVALTGKGWFSYLTPEGERSFGRDGRFVIDNLGNLVTSAGAQVLDDGGAPIAIPADAGRISISDDGVISDQNGAELGNIGMYEVPDIQGYKRLGNGMFAPKDPQQPLNVIADPDSRVSQGFVESSNVDPIREVTNLIDIQRAYERSTKMMENQDQLRKDMISTLGRTM